MPNEKNDTRDRELIMTRTYLAPVSLVWEAWINPEHLAKWWGPNGFTNTIGKMEVKPGGEFNMVMHGPDGTNYDNKHIFKEVVKHKKLVFDHISAPPFQATVMFEEKGDSTTISWHMLFATIEEFIQTVKTFGADEGLKETMGRLGGFVTGAL